jgi:hypothetical protein
MDFASDAVERMEQPSGENRLPEMAAAEGRAARRALRVAAAQRDRRYVLITAVVLALLLTSLMSGLGE